MSVNHLWQVLAIIWIVISVWIGGLGLMVALSVTFSHRVSETQLGGWRRILFNYLLLLSGVAATVWSFDRNNFLEQTAIASLTLGFLVTMYAAAFALPGVALRGRTTTAFLRSWWPRARIWARLALATAALIGARAESEESARLALLAFASVQLLLIVWELWLRWQFRNRT